jgi:hypothetical protein
VGTSDAGGIDNRDASSVPAQAGDASPYADLRTCSGNPLDTFVWVCAANAPTCPEAMRISQMCALPWGCDEYSLAVLAAAAQCAPGREVITAQACDRTVIELRVDSGPPTRAFYTNGGLMGIWAISDVTSDPETCSNFVPKNCLDSAGDSLSDVVSLCVASDGSTADVDADAASTDANSDASH